MTPLDTLAAYHELTKHHFHRFSPGPDGLDWANQPDPFRRYLGAPNTLLEIPKLDEPAPGGAAPFNLSLLACFFFDSLAISAWKQAGGSRWALRVNPSSGNLHPTEGYLICGPLPGLSDKPGIYHYAPQDHSLETRALLPAAVCQNLSGSFPPGTFFVGLSSIPWREAWKYGERAFRYCNHDIGHALAAISIAAGRQGWQARLLNGIDGPALAGLLGLSGSDGIQAEHPDCLLAIVPSSMDVQVVTAKQFTISEPIDWLGEPNILSEERVEWPHIIETAHAVFQAPAVLDQTAKSALPPARYSRRLLHQRRSAVAMDGVTRLDAAKFYGILRALMPDRAPFDMLPWAPRVHLVLFVHRVDQVAPGLYVLPRCGEAMPLLKTAFRDDFTWKTPPGCPDDLPLRQLISADCQEAARMISCQQYIASDGCFSLGMLAEFDSPLHQFGPAVYPRLFWECGFIGQLLYLEAEQAGIRGTGIGCFFDDAMHQVLGLRDRQYQCLYHFTMGGPEEDVRITTLPGYVRPS